MVNFFFGVSGSGVGVGGVAFAFRRSIIFKALSTLSTSCGRTSKSAPHFGQTLSVSPILASQFSHVISAIAFPLPLELKRKRNPSSSEFQTRPGLAKKET